MVIFDALIIASHSVTENTYMAMYVCVVCIFFVSTFLHACVLWISIERKEA